MADSVIISRPAFSNERFNETYEVNDRSDNSVSSQLLRWLRKQTTCSKTRIWNILARVFPVLSWLPKYKRKYIVGDLIAGWTVGIIRIPQGMAYALLAGVQPVYGLYSCFFPVLLWFVFSTSHHTSVGTMAVVCLMIQNLISVHVPDHELTISGDQLLLDGAQVDVQSVSEEFLSINSDNESILNTTNYIAAFQQAQENKKIQVASSATLLVGIIQLIMSLLRLGFLTTLLSDPVIQGFTTGAAFHVLTSQTKYMFGLDKTVGKHNGPFAIFKIFGDIFRSLPQANVADIVITIISLPSLLLVKYLNEKYKEKLRNIPIPIELILVVLATMVSYFGNLDDPPFNVNIVKTIPTGFPAVTLPPYTHLWSQMVTDCLIMAFISVAISLSLTKIYADKHGYDIDANQEIFALGICNTIPAFLKSFAVAASLSRTAIQESTGGKTQLVSILSSILMLIVLLWLAPLFQPVPKSVLACIIIVAMKSIFMQFRNIKDLWSVSKFDFAVWIVTCVAVIVLGVDLGLAAGVAMAIIALVFRIQHPKHAVLGRIMHTDLYADHKKYKDATEIPGIKIFHYADSVSFTNKDAFRNSLYQAVGCNPSTALSKLKKKKKREQSQPESNQMLIPRNKYATSSLSPKRMGGKENVRKRSAMPPDGEALLREESGSFLGFRVLILDATMWSFIDSTASREILQIIDKFKAIEIVVLLAGASTNVLKTLDGCGLPSHITHEKVFISVHDAVIHAELLIQQQINSNESLDESYSTMPGYPGYDSLAL